MDNQNIPLNLQKKFPKIVSDYLNRDSFLDKCYSFPPEMASFKKMIDQRNRYDLNRSVLVKSIREQYQNANLNINNKVAENLERLLSSNTYTVTTGHQLNIFTGPLFSLYKIISAIKLSDDLNSKNSEFNVVPVFWMASEDHDLEEINHFYLKGKKYNWENSESGAAGRISTKGLDSIIIKLLEDYPELGNSDSFRIIKEAYESNVSLSVATRIIINHLFEGYGLIVIDSDNSDLKK